MIFRAMPAVKKNKGLYCTYDRTRIIDALDAVRTGRLSQRQAAITYSIPKTTLGDRLRGSVPDDAIVGKAPALPLAVEEEVVKQTLEAADKGFGISRKQLMFRVGKVTKALNLRTPFKNDIPGKEWWAGFTRRHPEVTLRKPEALSTVRSRNMNPTVVGEYFVGLHKVLEDNQLQTNPMRIWNADETGISFEHKPVKVCARVGVKNLPGRVGSSRESMTMMACINAAGTSLPPLFIAKGKTRACLSGFQTTEGPLGSKFTWQSNAWMEDVLSVDWFEGVFLANIGPERPQILIWDSHRSHESLQIIHKARENNIILFTFPPHTTHFLCPLDRTVFGPFQRSYNTICSTYMSSDLSNTVKKSSVCALLKDAFAQAFTRTNIVSGFESTGINTFNPLAIPSESFIPSTATETMAGATYRSTDEHPLSWTLDKVGVTDTLQIATTPSGSAIQGDHPGIPVTPDTLIPPPVPVPSATVSVVAQDPEAASGVFQETLGMTVPLTVSSTPGTALDITLGDSAIEWNQTNGQPKPIEVIFPDGSSQLIMPAVANEVEVNSWVQEISGIFSPTKTEDVPSVRQKSKKITNHRLLTSDEIVRDKEEAAERKRQSMELKEERKKKREEKQNKVKSDKVAAEEKKKNVVCNCSICSMKFRMNDRHAWVGCDQCDRWMHQRCVPQYRQPAMTEAIDKETDFMCHVCTGGK